MEEAELCGEAAASGLVPDGETGEMETERRGEPDATDSGPGTPDPEFGAGEPEPGVQRPDAHPQARDLQAELEEARRRWLESHRRALLAENAGRVVPELVTGSSVEEMERSLEVARGAFEAARAAALAEIASTRVPAGNPVRQGPNLEAMSPMQKIAFGLRRE